MARIALLELAARFGAVDAALTEVRALLEAGPQCDLAVLPECGLTGYLDADGRCDPARFAEPLRGPTFDAASCLARAYDTAIAWPLIERAGDRVFNAFVVVDRAGQLLHHYRKRHPWYPETWATPGDLAMTPFEIAGVRLSLAICFDVHFLADEEGSLLHEIDGLIFPSAWVDEGDVDGRAIVLGYLTSRFGLTIANANWGPGTPRVVGQGSSRVVSPQGEIARAASSEGVCTRLDATLLNL